MPLDTMQPPFGHATCEKRWGGFRTAHCARCHTTFSGLTAFDAHRAGTQCRKPETIGLVLQSHRSYECWGSPTEEGDGWWVVG